MQHFSKDDGMNMFRLPVGWQFLVNNKLGGTLDAGNLAKYDLLVQGCLATGAYCVIDIHNCPSAPYPFFPDATPLTQSPQTPAGTAR
jgi:beta-glucosidase/6-phospho-beta-glucosidase/beta-galactosidase